MTTLIIRGICSHCGTKVTYEIQVDFSISVAHSDFGPCPCCGSSPLSMGNAVSVSDVDYAEYNRINDAFWYSYVRNKSEDDPTNSGTNRQG